MSSSKKVWRYEIGWYERRGDLDGERAKNTRGRCQTQVFSFEDWGRVKSARGRHGQFQWIQEGMLEAFVTPIREYEVTLDERGVAISQVLRRSHETEIRRDVKLGEAV